MAEPGLDAATETPPSRLMIEKIELENFKSYAGIKEIGPFHQCFSSVVGPNGSGKSNVIDAMLFVFGKRAKKLRLNKVSELIHHSENHQNATFARVSVYFCEIIDQNDSYTVIPGTQRVVTRIAKKDNSSTYKMDGRNCQFRDVAAYLGSKGIDLDNNRFLILQGEVEMISMMPPKAKNEGDEGLLEYLEDIIGSSQFVERTQEAAQVVEALSDQRQEKLNRVKAVEKEKDALQDAKLEAEALLKKDREIRKKQSILYQLYADRETTKLESLNGKKDQAQSQLEAERKKLDSSDARIEQLQESLSTQTKEYNKIHAELVKTKEDFAAFERRDIKLREELKHSKTQRKQLDAKIKKQAAKEEESLEKMNRATESIPELEAQIEELKVSKTAEDEALQEIYDAMKEETQELRNELEQKTEALAPLKEERAVFQGALDTATTEVELLEGGVTRAKEKLAKAESELATLDQKQESKRQELSNTEDELSASKERIVEAEREEVELAGKEKELSQRYTHMTAQLEEAKAALQSKGGAQSSPALRGILQAARKGGELENAGVLGRLGDLAVIPDKYDVAVSTASGSLNHIVVKTTAGAQKCLNFLRKHELGRANFIPLDKMSKGAHDRVVETPEGAKRLYDLIHPAKPHLAPAIFLAVGNTLVAPDLETASRWAYEFGKRWRVVTVDGKLIESSGAMSGGGNRVRRGGMKLTSGKSKVLDDPEDSSDIDSLETEVPRILGLLQDCRKRRKELVDEIRSLKKSVKSLETKLPKLSVEISGCDTTREELTRFIPELRSQCVLSDADAKKVKELNKKVAKCKTDVSTCSMNASKLETEVSKLQKAILNAGGSKLKKQQEACDQALKSLNETEKDLNSARVSVTSMEKAVAKAQKSKTDAEEEFAKCLEKVETLKKDIKALDEDAQKVAEEYEQVCQVEKQARKELDVATAEVEELKNSQSDAKCVEVELVGRLEDLKKQINDREHSLAKWESELAKLDDASNEDDMELSDDEDEEETPVDPQPVDGSDGADTRDESEDVMMDSVEEPPKESSSKLTTLSSNELAKYDKEQLLKEISVLETERNTIAKNANMGAIAEYRKKERDYLSRVSDLDAVTEERNNARQKHEDLRRQRLDMFMDGFGQITLKLKEMYQMITLGGDAELELVDTLDPFSEGIVFSVRPPKKSWKNISNLSGGEKTLSSLALVFALHHYKPTPLYVMDEIDAALDFKNVSIVANYIKARTRNAQFVIISLRNNMFELADRLVGIYKTNNCTKSISINPHAFCHEQQEADEPTPQPLGNRGNSTPLMG